MKKVKMFVAAGAIAAALAVVPATGSMALTSESQGGGLFQYGVEGGTVYSNYHHARYYHTATACNNGMIDKCRQVAAAKNQWAKASIASSWLGGNTSWWNVIK